MKLLIIIPAYNEELNIDNTVSALLSKYSDADYVVINDGSEDGTSDLCHKKGYPVLDLPINLGLAGAFQTGMQYAYENGYEAVLQFDGDGQHDASFISKMIEIIQTGDYDIVIGSRFVTGTKNKTLRMLGSRMITGAIKISTGTTINDPTSGMRLYGKNVIKQYANNMNYGPEPDTLAYLVRSGAKIVEVQVIMHNRTAGRSYLTISRSIRYMIEMIISILVVQFFRKKETL